MTNTTPPKDAILARCEAACPVADKGINVWTYYVAHRFREGHLDYDTYNAFCQQVSGEVGHRTAQEWELRRSWERVHELSMEQWRGHAERMRDKKPRWPVCSPDECELVQYEYHDYHLDSLEESSPLQCAGYTIKQVLTLLFGGDDVKVCVGRSKNNASVLPIAELKDTQLPQLSLISPNPYYKKDIPPGKKIPRLDINIGHRRFIVVEFDNADKNDQARRLLALSKVLHLCAIVDSGRVSLHGWFYCEGMEPDRLNRFFRYACVLGADKQLWVPSQYVRMPGATRIDKVDAPICQKILYLDEPKLKWGKLPEYREDWNHHAEDEAAARSLGDILADKEDIFRFAYNNEPVCVSFGKLVRTDSDLLPTRIGPYACPVYYNKPKEEDGPPVRVVSPPAALTIQRVLRSDSFRSRLPVIKRVLPYSHPVIDDSTGQLIWTAPGYSKALGIWTDPKGPDIDVESGEVERQMMQAKAYFAAIYERCLFKDERSKNVALSMLFAPFVGGLLPDWGTLRPGYIANANLPGCGKDYLLNIPTSIHTGLAAEAPPLESARETRSTIATAVKAGERFLRFSNNRRALIDGSLENLMTSTYLKVRELCTNRYIEGPNEMVVMLSANGAEVSVDLYRRTLVANLHWPGTFQELQGYRFGLNWVSRFCSSHGERGRALTHLASLIRWWDHQGRPKAAPTQDSWTEWEELVGGIMESCGYGNPCLRPVDENGNARIDAEVRMSEQDDTTAFMQWLFEQPEMRSGQGLVFSEIRHRFEGASHDLYRPIGFWEDGMPPKTMASILSKEIDNAFDVYDDQEQLFKLQLERDTHVKHTARCKYRLINR